MDREREVDDPRAEARRRFAAGPTARPRPVDSHDRVVGRVWISRLRAQLAEQNRR